MLKDENGTVADSAESSVRERIAALEQLLGDPHDPGNPFGHAALLAADERGELIPEAERALDGFGLNAEFVPRELGGRLDRVDNLARVLRPGSRRNTGRSAG
jgi:hypothetical protein